MAYLIALTLALMLQAGETLPLGNEALWKWQKVDGVARGSEGEANGWEQPGFDDQAWESVDIAKPFQQQGVVWYRNRFSPPESWRGTPVILRLGSPDDGAEVYVNGHSVGKTTAEARGVSVPIPEDCLKFGETATNVIAIRLWNWHQMGGLHAMMPVLQTLRPFSAAGDAASAVLPLGATRHLTDGVLQEGIWEYGYRDDGTSDTRPNLRAIHNAYEGQDALLMDIWYPNSREMVDYILPAGETGRDWAAAGAAYLAFRYRTSTLQGDMSIRLNAGRLRWGRRVKSFLALFPVEPSNDWREVILPLTAFVTYKNHGGEVEEALHDPVSIQALSIGYDNHRLRAPGTIEFTDFRVGAMPTVQPSDQPVSLAGQWRFRLDNQRPDGSDSDFGKSGNDPVNARDRQGYGRQLGWMQPEFDDSSWATLTVPATWEEQGYRYDGPAWYRAQVMVPEIWRGRPLRLHLGRPDDRGTAYWNGAEIQTIPKFGPHFQILLKPEQIKYGEVNQIALEIHDWYRSGGLNDGRLQLGPDVEGQRAAISLAWQGEPGSQRLPAEFEMGAKPPRKNAVVMVQFAAEVISAQGFTVDYRLVDCFHRQLGAGTLPVQATDTTLAASIPLTADQTRQLYYGEWFDAFVILRDPAGRVIDTCCQREIKLKYTERDELTLPALPDQQEETPYGTLKLIDVIDCTLPDTETPHPYKEGGVRASWVGTRGYATWLRGVTIETLQGTGERYREVNNNEFFGYRIGRGKLKPHTAYLLRLKVPDDKGRYTVIDIKAGRNYQGTGYRGSSGHDDPWVNYPLSGEMQWYDHLVFNDEVTYGYQGDRQTSSENGFWVFFHDNGRIYTGQYAAGAGVAEMRLYEVEDIESHYPVIRYPEGLPRRTLMMDWERQPEAPPVDVARYGRFVGLNVLAPVIQKWSSHGFWHSETGFQPPGWYRVLAEQEDDRDVYRMWLDATREQGIGFMPRIEYGGGPKLPAAARVIGPNGKVDPCGRYCRWGANILHEATWTELKTVVDELIGRQMAANPQIVGLLWRQRQDRIKPSYGITDVQEFCQDTGTDFPGGTPEAVAKWASEAQGKAYLSWWQRKRADFLRRLRDLLKSYNRDLILAYYNWDQDGWKLGYSKNETNTPEDWSDLYNVDRAHAYWHRVMKLMNERQPGDYVDLLNALSPPNQQIHPSLFSDDEDMKYLLRAPTKAPPTDPLGLEDTAGAAPPPSHGDIAIFAPVNGRLLADNEPYTRHFETADGLAICHMFDYEEKGRWNIQGDRYETSELTPGGHDYGMAEEVLACFHGDPNIITSTTYTYGRGWVDKHRLFAQAFLALPDMPGEVLPHAASPASGDLRVRLYRHGDQSYLGIVHRGTSAASYSLTLPLVGGTVTDLVSGKVVPSQATEQQLQFSLELGPMELRSFRIDK